MESSKYFLGQMFVPPSNEFDHVSVKKMAKTDCFSPQKVRIL
jgi:hypothetical protein